MKILAIIVSYNFMKWVDKCLGSLVASKTDCDIMVVDNGSADETTAHIRQCYSQVILVENGRNLGFGRANNIGMEYAIAHNYDTVLLLNQDAWVQPDTLGRLVEVSSRHPDYGIISPVHLTRDCDKPERGFAEYSGIRQLDCQSDTDLVAVPFIDAAIWLLPVSAIRKVGMFAPLFYHYGEDKDMANRMVWHGLQIGYVPHCYGCHDREDRQLTRFSFFRAERTYHLSQYANINLSLPRAFALGVLALGKKAAQQLMKGKLRDALTYTGIAFQLTARTMEVLKTRRQSKHVELINYQ